MKTYFWLYLASEGLTIMRPTFIQVQADTVDNARKIALSKLNELTFIGRASIKNYIENTRPTIITGEATIEPVSIIGSV